jgi:uncharacterized protein (TIGR03083 family)
MTVTEAEARPRRSAHPADVADTLAVEEYRRCAEAVAALEKAYWALPTDCTLWNVRQLVAHMIGMAMMASSPLQIAKQQRAAKARHVPGRPTVDALTMHQVELFEHEPPAELVRLMAWVGPKAARGRRRITRVAGKRTLPDKQQANEVEETWTIGYLLGTILTRDPWMHRVDLARATSSEMALTREHDGVIVADVVAEWAARHGQPFRLTLTGPAGGTWSSGSNGEEITMDAIEFCRVLSGRATGTGLLETGVPF